MDWHTFLNELNAQYKELGLDNPPVEIYDDRGNKYEIYEIYAEDGIIGIDVKRED
jgi:hypothetical protein